MSRASFSILAAVLLAALSSLAPAQSQAPATRPAAAATRATGPMRLPDMPLHDPFIVAHSPTKTYYLYTSNVARVSGVQAAGTMVYKSKDLLNWDPPALVFRVPEDSWANPATSPWAPEVHEYKGKFYLFTTLHNNEKITAQPPDAPRPNSLRATVIAVSDSPDGPFVLIKKSAPVTPPEFMTLDGTLFVDPQGTPWLVYAHEWIQKNDGTFEALQLKPDLSDAAGPPPIHLFKASDGPWINSTLVPSAKQQVYVTDGCQFYRSRTGQLLMLWSSYRFENGSDSYVQTHARSKSGTLQGPWEQLEILLGQDSGHGMLFHTFEGQLMLVVHRPFRNARGKLYEISDEGDHLKILRQRTDLDGDK